MSFTDKWLLVVFVIFTVSGGIVLHNISNYESSDRKYTMYSKEISTEEYTCEPFEVERVIDGDTLVTSRGETLRLAGIDAPEVNKSGAEEATRALTEYSKEKLCLVRDGVGYYGRTIAWIYNIEMYEKEIVISINEYMLRRELVEIYR
jgi:hypothetical protein